MTLDTVIMLVGAFVAVLPFLGFPNSWDTIFFFLAGILVVGLGILVRSRMHGQEEGTQERGGTYMEVSPSRAHDEI